MVHQELSTRLSPHWHSHLESARTSPKSSVEEVWERPFVSLGNVDHSTRLKRAEAAMEHKQLRIAQVAPLYEAVPPALYGGTERVVLFYATALWSLVTM
jgi:hypothetical protein